MVSKLQITLAVVCLVQLCLCARIAREKPKESSSSEELTDKDIDELRTEMMKDKSMTPQEVDGMMDIFKKFRKGATSDEKMEGVFSLLFLIAISDKNETKPEWLKEMMKDSSEEKSSENAMVRTLMVAAPKTDKISKSSSSSEELSENDLISMRTELSKSLSPKDTDKIMNIFWKFRDGATSEENMQGVMELMVFGMAEAMNKTEPEAWKMFQDSKEKSSIEVKNTL